MGLGGSKAKKASAPPASSPSTSSSPSRPASASSSSSSSSSPAPASSGHVVRDALAGLVRGVTSAVAQAVAPAAPAPAAAAAASASAASKKAPALPFSAMARVCARERQALAAARVAPHPASKHVKGQAVEWVDLPVDVLQMIAIAAGPSAAWLLSTMACTCRTMRSAVQDDGVWRAVFVQMYTRDPAEVESAELLSTERTWRSMVFSRMHEACVVTVGGSAAGMDASATPTLVLAAGATTWSTHAPMVHERRFPAAASLAGRVFAAGGDYNQAACDFLEMFDIEAGKWTQVCTFPSNSVSWFEGSMVSSTRNNNIYYFGGYEGRKTARSTAAISYNVDKQVWSESSDVLLDRREDFQCDIVDETVVYLGGGFNGSWLTTSERWDVRTPRSTSLPNLPHAARNGTMAAVDNVVYLIGGNSDYSTHHYDVLTLDTRMPSAWVPFSVGMPDNLTAFSVCKRGTGILLTGGLSSVPTQTGVAAAYVLDVDMAKWTPLSEMPASLSKHFTVEVKM